MQKNSREQSPRTDFHEYKSLSPLSRRDLLKIGGLSAAVIIGMALLYELRVIGFQVEGDSVLDMGKGLNDPASFYALFFQLQENPHRLLQLVLEAKKNRAALTNALPGLRGDDYIDILFADAVSQTVSGVTIDRDVRFQTSLNLGNDPDVRSRTTKILSQMKNSFDQPDQLGLMMNYIGEQNSHVADAQLINKLTILHVLPPGLAEQTEFKLRESLFMSGGTKSSELPLPGLEDAITLEVSNNTYLIMHKYIQFGSSKAEKVINTAYVYEIVAGQTRKKVTDVPQTASVELFGQLQKMYAEPAGRRAE